MAYSKKLLVVGGSFVKQNLDGTWTTSFPIANYLHELAEYFEECTWMVQSFEGEISLEGQLDPQLINVIPFKADLTTPLNWLRLIFCLRQKPYVILFFPALLTLLPVIPVVKNFSRKMVVYLGNDYDTTLNQGKKKWIGWSTLYRFSIEYCLKTADSVIVRGQYLAKKVSLFNKNVTETFPLGNINLNNVFCQQEKTKEDKHILFLGQVLWLKGLGDLFLALKLVIDSHPEAQIMLDVVGDGSERQEIEEKAKFLNLDAHIKFHGWVEEREKLSNFFNNADVLVVPTSSYPEGVPRVIDEALIQGLPVVATKVGGIAEEFANDEIMLVEPNCSDRLASSIAAILFDAKVRDFYLANMQSRSPKWAEYGSAAKQHKTILLGEYKSI